MSKVSVIVPAYNESKRINKCIESLINQSYENIEIIVVDDGSTDDTLDILKGYSDNRIKVFSKKNGGQGSARNLGIKKASSPYLMFVDADDYVDKNIIEKLLENLEKHNSDISICNLYKILNNKKCFFKNLDFFCNDNIINFMLSHPGPVGRLYKKELFENNNINFLEGLINEDLGTIPLLGLYAKKINYIDDALYYYVIHDNSTTMQTIYSKKMEDIFKVLEHIKSEFQNRNFGQYDEVLEYLYIEHLLYSATLKFVDFKEGKSQINRVISIMKKEFPTWKQNKFFKQKSIKFKVVCYLIYIKHLKCVKLLKKIRK